MSKILVVEDDAKIARNVSLLLSDEGFVPVTVASQQAALTAVEQQEFDLILLDLSLPDGHGYALCTQIKSQRDIPIIFLTAMNDEASIVAGFNLGGDDYISKPFKPLELISRIKNLLRRYGKSPAVLQLADLKVDTVRAQVSKNGREILLSALEYRLLLVFLNHAGQLLSRSYLLETIWDMAGDYVNDNTLTVYIKRLRDKIEDDPTKPTILKTVRGLGYKVGD